MALTISVKRLDGEKSIIQVQSTETIKDLKTNFGQKIGIDPVQLRLVFKGAPLRDDMTVADAKIKSADTIHMILQLNG